MKHASLTLTFLLLLFLGQTAQAGRNTALQSAVSTRSVSQVQARRTAEVISAENLRLASQVLVSNDRHLVSVGYTEEAVTITLEALGDGTNNLGGPFPNVDFVTLRIDRNRNGKVDERLDVAYGIASGARDRLCAQYLLSENASTSCTGFPSEATLEVDFRATRAGSSPHPVWRFTLPKQELTTDGGSLADIALRFHEAGNGYTRYPASRLNNSFAKVFTVPLAPARLALRNPAALRLRREIVSPPVLRPGDVLEGRPTPAAATSLVSNNRHAITARSAGDRIVFILEALADSTNDLGGAFPRVDFVTLRVDRNRNGKVDERLDVAYGIASGARDRLCAQYLLSENASTSCTGFPSETTLKVRFGGTANGLAAYPVWMFAIPKKELTTTADSLTDVAFQFYEAGRGYTRYPATEEPDVSFSTVMTVNLNTLDVTLPASQEPEVALEDEEPIITTNDTAPPLLVITDPPDAANAEVIHEDKTITIGGRAEDESGLYEILVNGEEADVSPDGTFQQEVRLAYGRNQVRIEAVDLEDNVAEEILSIMRTSATSDVGAEDSTRNVTPAEGTEGTAAGTDTLDVGAYHALLIAVQDYSNPEVNDLDFPLSDAERLKDVLIRHYMFDSTNVALLQNPGEDAIVIELERLRTTVGATDNLVIFFAGHGQWDEQAGQGYWLPSDAAADSRANWISNGDVRDHIRSIPSKHTLLISDACFSGGLFKTRSAFVGSDASIQELYRMPSRKAMTSGTLTEVPDQSAFLEYFVARLQENTIPWLPADQLFSSLRPAVINNSHATPQYGVIFGADDEGGEFIFVRRP